MKQYKWLNKRLITGVLVSVILAVTASVGLSTSPMVSASNPPPETEWEQIIGGSRQDIAYSVWQTTDGGYIMAGQTRSYSVGDEWHAYLLKTDASGNMEWEQALTENVHSSASSIEQTTDSGYIIGGDIWSENTSSLDFYLVKTDASGNIEWEKSIAGGDADLAYAEIGTAQG